MPRYVIEDAADFVIVVCGWIACFGADGEGHRAEVIEHGRLGGTCVNVGCVPKKVMWNAASLASNLKISHDYGFSPSLDFDFPKIKTAISFKITDIS